MFQFFVGTYTAPTTTPIDFIHLTLSRLNVAKVSSQVLRVPEVNSQALRVPRINSQKIETAGD